MNLRLLEVHRDQFVLSYNGIAFIPLHDPRLNEVRNAIGRICSQLQYEDLELEDEPSLMRDAISLLQEWSGWIANQESGTKAHLFIDCISLATSEWLSDWEQYVFVATDGDFAIWADPPNVDFILDWIWRRFHVQISYRLVHFQMPFHLKNDYLFNVALYHELGHFIDSQLMVTNNMAMSMTQQWLALNPNCGIRNKMSWDNNTYIFQNHLKELFADLFAVQYVDESLINYMEFKYGYTSTDESTTHPSSQFRIDMLRDFCQGAQDNPIINELSKALHAVANRKLTRITCPVQDLLLTSCNFDSVYHIFLSAWYTFHHHTEVRKIPTNMIYPQVCEAVARNINMFITQN